MPFNQATLLHRLGNPYTNRVLDRLHDFAFLPQAPLDALHDTALPEDWGSQRFLLKKYLAVHVPWAIEQGQYTRSADQFYMRAGHLQTRYGSPIYLVFEENQNPDRQPYCLRLASSSIVTNDQGIRNDPGDLPGETKIPQAEPIPVGAYIEMRDDHIIEQAPERLPFLEGTPVVSKICAIAGAIEWALNLNLQLPLWHFGRMNYVVPLYLTSREDIMAAPDAVAPLQLVNERLIVRTILEPQKSYPNARVAVKRHDELAPWMQAVWQARAAEAAEDEDEVH